MQHIITLIGRMLIAAIFLLAGMNKTPGYTETQAYIEAYGIPGTLLPEIIELEIGGALALILG